MTNRTTHITLNVSPRTGLQTAGLFQRVLFLLALIICLQPLTTFAQIKGSISHKMAYIPHGPTIIGIDKDPSSSTVTSSESVSMYQRRMSMPWSKEAFHDEGPAHWVFLDGTLGFCTWLYYKQYDSGFRDREENARNNGRK